MNESFNDLIELLENKIEFVKRMGLKILEIKPRYIKLTAPLKSNENHIGTMYAGAQFTLAEVPGGALCWVTFDMNLFYPIVKEMTIRFKKPVTSDVFLELSISKEDAKQIENRATETGKAEFVLEGEITDETGEVVAASKGIYQLRVHSKTKPLK